jgi:hypothetical protein
MPSVLRKYQSKTNPGKVYSVVKGDDGVLYCDCWGWKTKRDCWHLQNYRATFNQKEPSIDLNDVVTQEVNRLGGE